MAKISLTSEMQCLNRQSRQGELSSESIIEYLRSGLYIQYDWICLTSSARPGERQLHTRHSLEAEFLDILLKHNYEALSHGHSAPPNFCALYLNNHLLRSHQVLNPRICFNPHQLYLSTFNPATSQTSGQTLQPPKQTSPHAPCSTPHSTR